MSEITQALEKLQDLLNQGWLNERVGLKNKLALAEENYECQCRNTRAFAEENTQLRATIAQQAQEAIEATISAALVTGTGAMITRSDGTVEQIKTEDLYTHPPAPDREKLLGLAKAACAAWGAVDNSDDLETRAITPEGIQQHARLENAMRELRAALGGGVAG